MLALSPVLPEKRGLVTETSVPFDDYLQSAFSEGIHSSILANIYQASVMAQEMSDEIFPILEPDVANRLYPLPNGEKWESPVRENVAMLLLKKRQEENERLFYLEGDSNSLGRKLAGFATTTVASMLNPVDLALLFLPVVGQETKIAKGASILGRGKAIIKEGLITREALAKTFPKAPKLAESVIQGASYMSLYELTHQVNLAQNRKPEENPLVNVAVGTGAVAGLHIALSKVLIPAVVKLWQGLHPAVKQAMLEKATDDILKGRDVDVAELIKLDKSYAAYQKYVEDVLDNIRHNEQLPIPEEPLTIEAFQQKIRGIFDEKLQQLRQEVLKPGERPVVPETAPEVEAQQYTSLLDEIRQKGLKTKAQIQQAFPKANLTREEAGMLRREAWGEQEVKEQYTQNIVDYIEYQKEQLGPKRIGAKRAARLEAERNMPNPFPKQEVEAQAHDALKPEDTAIAAVEEQVKKLEKKVKEKVKEKEKPIDIATTKAGLVKQKGANGKKGWYTTEDPRLQGLSVVITEKDIHLNHIEVLEKGKGVGGEWLEKLKTLADTLRLPLTLDAVAKSPELGPKLNAFYEKHGLVGRTLELDKKNNPHRKSFVYKPKVTEPTVYHGTPEEKITKLKEGFTYFSSSKDIADEYTYTRGIWRGTKKGSILSANIKFKNPLIIDALGARNDNIPTPWHEWKQKVFGNLPKDAWSVTMAALRAEAEGYDGLIVKNVIDSVDPATRTKSDVWVSFNTKQIKNLKTLEAPKPQPEIIKAAIDCLGKTIL